MSLVRKFDRRVIDFTRRRSLLILRLCLGLVFLWFGGLKIAGVSPIAGYVVRALPFLPARVAIVSTGLLEIVIALGLLTGYAIRVTLALFFMQMLGTFSTIIVNPELVFLKNNPLLLTDFGEFLVKNLVFIAAGLAIVGTVPKASDQESIPELLTRKAPGQIPANPKP